MFKSKFIFICLLLMLIMSTAYAGSITTIRYDGADHKYTARDVSLVLNGDEFVPKEGQMPPIILNSRTLVPVREVFEELGGEVNWDSNDRRVDVSFDDKTISLWIDNTNAKVNGNTIALDVPAKIVNNKTMVPVRFISEQGGLVVEWNAELYQVSIHYQKANITNVALTRINGISCMVITASSKITGYKYTSLPKDENNDFRIFIDIENCDFKFDTTNKRFEGGILKAIRFGHQGNNVNRIVLDLVDETDYVVAMSKDRLKLYYALSQEFVIPGEEQTENKEDNNTVVEPEQKEEEIITVEESGENIIVSGDETPKTPTVEENPKEEVAPSGNDENASNDVTTQDSGDSGEEQEEEKIPIYIQEEEPEETYEDIDYDVIIKSIKYSTVSKRVKISYEGSIEYEDEIQTNPNRLVLDIKSAKLDSLGPTEINIKNSIITAIRFSQYTKDSVRIVLDLNARGEHKIYLKSSEIQIDVKESTYKNIKYKKNSSNSQITLLNADVDSLQFRQDKETFRYYITYNENKSDFGSGVYNINDKFVKSITVLDGKITVLDCGNMVYAERQSGKNVIITIREEEKVKEKEAKIEEIKNSNLDPSGDSEDKPLDDRLKKRILIDVGHGGADPGACNGDEQEKKYNVKIAQYLYDLLKDREDLIVDINRTEDNDRYFTVQTRLQYALDFNPDFIISIHINSIANKNYTGTMVLYSNNDNESDYGDITSKECAQIVVNELSKALDTVNRGVVERNDLHILRDTPCPSVLCEVCFISNDAELERLKTKSFQKKAAQAMYNGIEKILKEM